MWAADVDKAQPGDIVLDWGNKVSGSTDTSKGPLFVKVNENLFQRPVYSKLIDIYNANLYHPAVCTAEPEITVCTAEPEITGDRKTQLDDYMKTLTNTTVFQLAYQYLVQQGSASSDFATFYDKLFNLWYGTYSRCKGPLGSSGWEHVFSGEWKGEEIDGQHNWVRYYLLEKAGDINYHGYYSHENDLIGTFQYKWKSYFKKTGGFFISTSPPFDLSIMTVCVLTHPGANACKFNIDGNKISITSYHQSCGAGTCISTDYPSDE
uniref:Endoribonuclease n=1 Tax=Panagrolaimus sp. JU765 TaxID=591449 RepID=A0AC34R560_9BILA